MGLKPECKNGDKGATDGRPDYVLAGEKLISKCNENVTEGVEI